MKNGAMIKGFDELQKTFQTTELELKSKPQQVV
jgi:hypothetical protein